MNLDPVTLHLAAVADAAMKLLERRRREMVEMLKSCGVDPSTVPMWPEVWREGPYVYTERFMFDDSGRLRRDDYGPMVEEFAMEPDVVPDWIPFD